MKILLFSDVHSNFAALQALERQEKQWDAAWFAGDMIDYGLQPHEVIDWMRTHNVTAVTGNHDTAMAQRGLKEGLLHLDDPLTADSFARHNLACMTEEDLAYVAALPETAVMEADGIAYGMVHSADEDDTVVAVADWLVHYQSEDKFEAAWKRIGGPAAERRCLIFGHSHHCMAVYLGGENLMLNPGSLSYHLGADSRTKAGEYMVIEDGVPSVRRVTFDSRPDYEAVERSSFGDWEKRTGLAIFRP